MAENPIADWLFGDIQAQKSTNKTAPSIRGRGGVNRPPTKPVAAPTPSSRSDYPSKPATSGAPFNPGGKRSVVKSGPDPLSANQGKRDWLAGRSQAKGAPEPAKNSRPASGRPSTMPAARKSPETAAKPAPAKQAVTSPAPSSAPKTNPAPASKKSWWDRFSDDHKLSADKSYADYKRLMGDN